MKILKKNSIKRKVLIAMIFTLIVQASLFLFTVLCSGIMNTLKENSFDLFNDRINEKSDFFENQMMKYWSSNISTSRDRINSYILKTLKEKGLSTDELNSDNLIANEILKDVSEDILSMLRQSHTTGAFIILDTKDKEDSDLIKKEGFYIKDFDPSYNLYDNQDLHMEIGSLEIADKFKLNLDKNWSKSCLFRKDRPQENLNFFYKPINEAIKNKNASIKYSNLGYWSKPAEDAKENYKVITYSLPLIDVEGNPYGVIGIDMDLTYINKLFKETDLNKEYSYIIGIDDNYTNYNNILVGDGDGILDEQSNTIEFDNKSVYKDIYKIKNIKNKDRNLYGSIGYLDLYDNNSPFIDEKWTVIGIVEKDILFGHINKLIKFLLLASIISTIIGIFVAIILGNRLTKPIRELSETVIKSDPQGPLELKQINISEIDDLSMAITTLSAKSMDSASKLTQIIELLNMPIGAFEYSQNEERVYCTKGFFKVMGLESLSEYNKYSYKKIFNLILGEISRNKLEGSKDIYVIKDRNALDKYIRLNVTNKGLEIFGVITDVTQEVLEKKKIEYERDHDALTNLMDRRAFKRIVINKLKEDNIGIGAFVMCDMDNLKFVNDTYGHDCGDEYLKEASIILKEFENYNGIVSRRSGDEFVSFIYGYENKDQIRDIVNKIHKKMKDTVVKFSKNEKIRLRASFGIAWYPDDSNNYYNLSKYADFAMYKIKHTLKGNVYEFNKEEYNEDSFLFDKREELNKLIDEELVKYAFQPIVDAHTGEIYAYEALMRSKLESIKSPIQIISLATAESKLYQIEKLTWFKALEAFAEHEDEVGDAKLFINSIPNYVLSDDDAKEFEERYSKYLSRLVIEFLENEKSNSVYTVKKKKLIEKWNANLAIDDFGSGYNNEATLLEITPGFVKIDMEIVRGIDKDQNRQQLAKNLVSYASGRNIKIIAEGVETREELEKVIELGVDYIQGYYLSKPSFNPPQRVNFK